MPMPVQLMAKAVIRDRQERYLLLIHPNRSQLFFPGGRLINPKTKERYRLMINHPKELANVSGLFPGAGRESGAKAIRRRLTEELTDTYKLLPNLVPQRVHVEYGWPAFMRIEPNSTGEQTVYIYLMSRVRLSGRSIRRITRALNRQPELGAFVTLEEIRNGVTKAGVPISPNVLFALEEIRLAPRMGQPPTDPPDADLLTSSKVSA